VLVTLVGPDVGAFALDHPPATPFDVPTGLQYALETYRGGFLVSDGHHNRVLRVTRDGQITVLRAFGNIVPTGLEVRGRTIYMAEAGPVPHLPETGKVVAFRPGSTTVREVASGSPLLVDVEFGRGRRLYALSQGIFGGGPAGSPALPDTGALVKANRDGTFTVVIDGLNQPTSLEFIKNTAYAVTLGRGDLEDQGRLGSAPPRLGVSNGASAGAVKESSPHRELGKLPLGSGARCTESRAGRPARRPRVRSG
jgi:hypothetical protein